MHRLSILHVLPMGRRPEVCWIEACGVEANVIDHPARWQGAVLQFITHPMRKSWLTVD